MRRARSIHPENSKPVVLHVISRMNIGGPAKMLTELVLASPDAPVDFRLACGFVQPGEDEVDLSALSSRVFRISGLGRAVRPLDDLRAFVELFRLIRRIEPSVVHTHGAKAGVLGRLAAIISRVPGRVHTFHGHLLHGYFSPMKTRLVILVERLLARSSTRLVAVGSRVRDDLVGAGIGQADDYSIVLPVGPPISATARDDARQTLGILPDDFVVAFIGRLTRIKRPDRAVEAFERLTQGVPRSILLVVGDGELRLQMERDVTRLRLRAMFVGWIDELGDVFGATDVVALTSDNEGTPLVLMESAQAGVPVVATAVGSVSDVVVDGVSGLVVEPTAPAIAAALEHLAVDDSARSRLSRGAKHESVRFSTKRMIEQHLEIYREQVARSEAVS